MCVVWDALFTLKLLGAFMYEIASGLKFIDWKLIISPSHGYVKSHTIRRSLNGRENKEVNL